MGNTVAEKNLTKFETPVVENSNNVTPEIYNASRIYYYNRLMNYINSKLNEGQNKSD